MHMTNFSLPPIFLDIFAKSKGPLKFGIRNSFLVIAFEPLLWFCSSSNSDLQILFRHFCFHVNRFRFTWVIDPRIGVTGGDTCRWRNKDFFLLVEGPDPGSRIRIRNITWSYETRLQRQGKNTFHINKFCSLWNLVKSVNWWQGGQSVWSIKLGFARTCTLQHMRISVYYYLIQNQFDLAVHGQPNFYSVHGRHLKYLFITSSLLHTIDPCVRVENE